VSSKKTVRSKSAILKLPAEVVRRVNEMLVEIGPGRKTYEEIADWVQSQGHRTSRSAIDRYAKYFFALEKAKLLGEQAKVIIDEAGAGSPLALEEATSKLGTVVVMELLQEVMKADKINPKRLGFLLGDFARLQTSSVSRERLKMDFKRRAAKAIENIEKTREITPDLLQKIREEVYGIF
jgi:hypothetical protein